MTIRELEAATGLDRSNIRFYEREGLLAPVRLENGYRDYSREDLSLLQKIKLLRRLDFSLDAIRALRDGEEALDTALGRKLEEIALQKKELDARTWVCTRMRRDGAEFGSLDAQRYLREFESPTRDEPVLRPAVPATDRVEPAFCPFRRLLARTLDMALLQLGLHAVLALGFRVNLPQLASLWRALLYILAALLLLPVESLFISLLGTTPGKWLLGIRLEHVDGRKLTCGEALARAKEVFAKGMGWCVPGYQLVRYWKSYKAYLEYGLDWDYDVHITAREPGTGHILAYAAAYGALMALTVTVAVAPSRPPHRGPALTVAQVVENYNYLAEYYGDPDRFLQADGTFSELPANVIGIGELRASFSFTETDGVVTAVTLTEECDMPFTVQMMGTDRALFMSMAYLGADDGYFTVNKALKKLDRLLTAPPGTDWEWLLGGGVTVTVEAEEYEPNTWRAHRRTVTLRGAG